MADRLRCEIEDDFTSDGLRWRAVIRDNHGRLIDSTRSVTSPARATRDLQLLVTGRYWAGDGGDPYREWSTAA